MLLALCFGLLVLLRGTARIFLSESACGRTTVALVTAASLSLSLPGGHPLSQRAPDLPGGFLRESGV